MKAEQRGIAQKQHEIWSSKVVVASDRFVVDQERPKTSQLDKIQPLLHDPPQKHGIAGKYAVPDVPLSAI